MLLRSTRLAILRSPFGVTRKCIFATTKTRGFVKSRLIASHSQDSLKENTKEFLNLSKTFPRRKRIQSVRSERLQQNQSETTAKGTLDEEILKEVVHAAINHNMSYLALHVFNTARAHQFDLNTNLFEEACQLLITGRHWSALQAVLGVCYQSGVPISTNILNAQMRAHLHEEKYSELQMETVKKLFERHGRPLNSESYNLIIEAHIANRDLQGCRRTIIHMENAGFPITLDTHRAVLSRMVALGPNSALEGQIFASLGGINTSLDVTIMNLLIRLRSVAGDDKAIRRYLRLLLKSQNPRGENGTVEESPPTGWDAPPDITTITLLIEHYARRRNFKFAMAAFDLISILNLKHTPEAVAHMISAYGRCDHLQDALSLVAVLFHQSSPSRILRAHDLLIKLGWDPSIRSGDAPSIPVNVFILNALLAVTLPTKGLDAALIVLDLMKLAFVAPDDDTVRHIMSFLDKHEKLSSAALNNILPRLTRSTGMRLRHVNIIYHALLRESKRLEHRGGWKGAAARRREDSQRWRRDITKGAFGRVHRGFSLLEGEYASLSEGDEALRRNFEAIDKATKQDHATYSLRMFYHARITKDPKAVERLYEEMVQNDLKPNAYHLAALIDVYCNTDQLDKAKRLLLTAYAEGIEVNRVLYTQVIQAYGDKGDPNMGRALFLRMLAERVKPDVASLEVVVRGYFLAQNYLAAKSTLLEFWHTVLPPQTIPPDTISLGQAMQQLRRVERHLRPSPPIKGPGAASFSKGMVVKWQRTVRKARLRNVSRAVTKLSLLMDGEPGEQERGVDLISRSIPTSDHVQ